MSSIFSCYTLLLFMMERLYALTRPLSSVNRYIIHSNPKGRLPVSVIALYFAVRYFVAIISMGKRELVALLCLSSWCLVIVVWLFLTMPRVYLQSVIVVFPDHTHLLFLGISTFLFLITSML